MSRLTQSDIIRAQEARIDSLTLLVESFLALERERLDKARTASETFKIARSGTGDHTTSIAVDVVVQDGETLADARNRAAVEYEAACARYPMANGLTHAAPLSSESRRIDPPEATAEDEKERSRNQALRGRIAAAKGGTK